MTAEGVIARQGHETADGRLFQRFEFRETVRLRAQFEETGYGHDGAVAVGVITRHEVRDNGDVYAWMSFADTDRGREAAQLVDQGALSGISIDGSNTWAYEVSTRLLNEHGAVVTEEQEAAAEAAWIVDERAKARRAVLDAGGDEDDADAAEERVWPDWHAIMLANRWRAQTVFERTVIAAATLVATPAFPDAEIRYTGTPFAAAQTEVMAGAVPVYPAAAFARRNFARLTPITWTDYTDAAGAEWIVASGHAAPWDVPHEVTGQVLRRNDFSLKKYLTGEFLLDDGTTVAIGQLTVGEFHGRSSAVTGKKMSNSELLEHYERSDLGAAHWTAYLDDHGLQVCGVVSPHATPAQIEQAIACPPSVHTRRTAGTMTLYGLLAVPSQGFVIERYDDDGDSHEIAASWAGIGAGERRVLTVGHAAAVAAADRQVFG